MSFTYVNPPFLILKVRHPAVTGVYCIVGVVVVMISNEGHIVVVRYILNLAKMTCYVLR